jgi:predicted DNA-binding ribbon-helix-helix protein
MTIYNEARDFLDHMFNSCTTAQINEFIPEKRGFRLHGHSTTVALERAFWNVLEAMAQDCGLTVPRLIERVLDGCLVANDKNLSSCLRVISLKYLNIYAMGDLAGPSADAEEDTGCVRVA